MSALDKQLARLLGWLDSVGIHPPSQAVRVFEVCNARLDSPNGTLRIRRCELRAPTEFAARFDELLAAGWPWLNLSCYGVSEDFLLVGIELPNAAPVGNDNNHPTSVNLSGPARMVLDQGWKTDSILAIIP